MAILLMTLAMLVMIFINVPIAIALAIAAVGGIIFTQGVDSLVTVGIEMYRGATGFTLIAVPMFVLAGAIMNAGGISRRLRACCRIGASAVGTPLRSASLG